MTGYLNQIVFC